MTPSPIGRARESIREAAYANARAIAFMDYLKVRVVLDRELADSLEDRSEVDLKLEGIHSAGQVLHNRLYEIEREASLDDRESTVPPTDMTWVR